MKDNDLPNQSIYIDCTYCKFLSPQSDTKDCEYCNGQGSYNRPARMMDTETSQIEVLRELVEFTHTYDNYLAKSISGQGHHDKNYKRSLFTLIEKMRIYNFDLLDTLRNIYRDSFVSDL